MGVNHREELSHDVMWHIGHSTYFKTGAKKYLQNIDNFAPVISIMSIDTFNVLSEQSNKFHNFKNKFVLV